METRTLTVEYEVGTTYESKFSWTVTNVIDSGTFVDGSPWVVVGSGAELIDLSPRSEIKTTQVMDPFKSGHYTFGQTADIYINGTVKNYVPRNRINLDAAYNDYTENGFTGDNKSSFDSRHTLPARISSTQILQDVYDQRYDSSLNIGFPVDGSIVPVGLTSGDVIVTAKSEFQTFPADVTPPLEIPNVRYGRSPIYRYGVLTVLQDSPSEPCFRPPSQWVVGDSKSRPTPIALSSIIEPVGLTFIDNDPNRRYSAGSNSKYITSPTIHDGQPVFYQSTHAKRAIGLIESNVTYFGSSIGRSAFTNFYHSLNYANPVEDREEARNKLIQYGIDCYGSAMSLNYTSSGAGQRSCELLPFILVAGYYLNNEDMINIYATLKNRYAGTVWGDAENANMGNKLFFEEAVYQRVNLIGAGNNFRHTLSPNTGLEVASAETIESFNSFPFPEGLLTDTKNLIITGKFGKLNISGSLVADNIQDSKKDYWAINYFNCYLKVTNGPGSGDTLYKIIQLGRKPGKPKQPGQYFIVDRPWVNGTPDNTSTVEVFAFRDGLNGVDGSTADIGRYYYSVQFGTTFSNFHGGYSLSPHSHSYGAQVWQDLLVYGPALLKLYNQTGLTAYADISAIQYYTQTALGINYNCIDNSIENFNTPSQELYGGVAFNNNFSGNFLTARRNFAGSINGLPFFHPAGTSFDQRLLEKTPGYNLTFDSTAISRVLNNWGNPGNSDFNADGNTNSIDLSFILDKFAI